MSRSTTTPATPTGMHACSKCHKTFSRAVNRDRHLATHNTVPLLACSICQRRFHRADVLAKHVQRHSNNSATAARGIESISSLDRRRTRGVESHPSSTSTYTVSSDASQYQQCVSSLAPSRKASRACCRCSKEKARCDQDLPACRQCTRLNEALECSYHPSTVDSAMSPTMSSATTNPQVEATMAAHAASSTAQKAPESMPTSQDTFALHASPLNNINNAAPHMQSGPSAHPMPAHPVSSNIDTSHHSRTIVPVHMDHWRQSQADMSDLGAWGSSASPLPLDWLLQADVPDQGWTAYLGDPGVPLLATYLDSGDASFSRLHHASHTAANSDLDPPTHASSTSTMAELDISRPPDFQVGPAFESSQVYAGANTPHLTARSSVAQDISTTSSPSMNDAAAAAATLARFRSAPVCRGLLRSTTPSEDASGSSRSASPDLQASTLRLSTSVPLSSQHVDARGSLKRVAGPSAGPVGATSASQPSPRLQRSSSASSDVDPMEVANRDVAAQPRQHRISYRNPDPSVLSRHFGPSPAAPSPERLARQETMAEDMQQIDHGASYARRPSPHVTSDRSSKRRKRRHTFWPSVYRPKATDGGKHLGLHKVPLASAEVVALENSYHVAPMTDVAKERMIDEFRYCEVEAQDLKRIQDTLRSIETSTLNLFVQLYFEHHDPILPILHRPTFDPDTCDPLLLAAVTCLGALCSKADNAFSYSLLTSSLVHAVSYKLIGINHLRGRYLPSMQTLLLTYLLWRNLGDPAKLEYVEGFRNIVLTMARRCRLFELDAFLPDPSLQADSAPAQENADLKAAWQEQEWQRWIRYQEMVRINWALFVLDSDLSLAWDLPCTVTVSELRSTLPCPESLWQVESAEEWSRKLEDEQVVLAAKSLLQHLFATTPTTHDTDIARSPHAAGAQDSTSAAKITSAVMQHTSPLTHFVLSAAVHNVVLSRCDLDTALTQLADLGYEYDGDAGDRGMTVPSKDAKLESWVDKVTLRLHTLSARMELSGKGDALLMLHGARLRMLVSFKAVQIMSGRKGRRRSKLQMRRWLQGPLQDEEYRNDIFSIASKIFTLSLASRRDAREPHMHSASKFTANDSTGGTAGDERSTRHEPRLSNMGQVIVSGTGADNSLLFYATVCLVLVCQSLVHCQRTDRQVPHAPSWTEPLSTRRPQKKDVYFLPGVGALTNPMSLDRLVYVAVHQGLNCSAWPLGQVLAKVLQQWAHSLERRYYLND